MENVIKTSKNNKAPGPDGFSNEFFKFFEPELKFWILKAYKESEKKGYFSDNIIQGYITCIPKTGKNRNTLKNWRPLTLLNPTYKFFSSIIANKIKITLERIINPDQTGFLSNRFIGENTRLLLDTINYCETFNKPGLIVVVDYAKAFDTIEWSFIDFCLELFGFGDNIRSWVNILQKKSFSMVEQNGHYSEKIELSRGCRQGDPISPYLFVICAEVLSHVLRECSDVKGIDIEGIEVKLSQYADDTTLYLQGDKGSLCAVMGILGWFKKLSGLGVNREKTKVIKIGAYRGRSIPWEGKFGLTWTTSFEVLGVKYNINTMGEITELNLQSKKVEIKKLIAVWSSRRLTPYGKVVIIKSLLYSKFTHLLLSLPSQKPQTLNELGDIINNFLWAGKPAKFSRHILEAEIKEGGLKLHNLIDFNHALKISWLKRYLASQGKWRNLICEEFANVFKYGPDYLDRLEESTSIPFWKDVITALKKLWSNEVVNMNHWVLHTPVWHSPFFRMQIIPEWNKKGIHTVYDFLYSDRGIMTQEDFELKYIKTNFLVYGSVKMKIKDFLSDKEMPIYAELSPQNSLINMIISQDKKGVSNLYKYIHGRSSDILYNICQKWDTKASLNFNASDISKSFVRTHVLFDDVYLKCIQFRTLHYRFYTNDMLKKFNIKDTDICDFCNEEIDSNFHMLIDCNIIRSLWQDTNNWINDLTEEVSNKVFATIIIMHVKRAIFSSKIRVQNLLYNKFNY